MSDQIQRLKDIMQKLRNPDGGCPWDLEQDHKSIRQYLLEEAYEVVEAIDLEDDLELKEELGDLLLQVVFHSQMAKERGAFDFEAVAKSVSDKMIRRHPHVFGDTAVAGSGEVLKNWDEIKKQEKQAKGKNESSALDGIPKGLAALMESFKISKKAAKLGFDWKNPQDVFAKIEEEIAEVKEAFGDDEKLEEELGDLLFAVSNLCRKFKVNPEVALLKANLKFKTRFQKMETQLQKNNTPAKELSLEEWEALWNTVKKQT